jgi:arylmalonate decarboxylase
MIDNTKQVKNRSASWRARIGTIIPVSNTTNEVEFNRMKPDGITVHFTRVPLESDPAEDDFVTMLDAAGHAASQLATAGADIIAYGCTSGSMACPQERLDGRIAEASGKPALSTAGAILRALEALGVKSLAMATPYTDATNAKERAFIERHGYQVTEIKGMGLGGSLENIQKISRVSPRQVFDHALSIDNDEADALLICCTDLGTADILQQLEDSLGKPVISSNTATFWASLRAAGIDQKVSGYGRLLSEF